MQFKHIVFDHDGTLVDPNSLEVYPEVMALLELLHKKSIKLYIWTARDRASTISTVKSNQILPLFEDVATATDSVPKPDVAGLDMMLNNVEKKEILMIGDSTSDMYGAVNYGICTVGVNWHNKLEHYSDDLFKAGAARVFNKVEDLKEYILK